MELTGKQRAFLRSLAHHVDATAQVGHDGITEAVVAKIASELEHHELIKVRFGEGVDAKAKDAAAELATATSSALVQVIGRVVVLYKRHPKQPVIVLPKTVKPKKKPASR